MFGHLMRGELARLRYRRRAWGSLILMLVAGLLAPAVWMEGIAMPTEADITLAMGELVRMQKQGDCLDCTFRDLLGWPTFDVVVRNDLSAAGIAFAFLTFMIVVAYVGADFSSGAISTQLTFTPRRSLVLTTRALACGVLGALLMAVGLLTTTGVTVVGYLATNGVDSIGEASGLLRLLGGGIVYGGLLGVIAALVTFIIPSTPLAMGAAVVVLITNGFVVDEAASLSQNGATLLYRILPAQHGIAFVYDESPVATGQALVYHLVVVGVLFAVAAFLFERRDIKA